jgi:stage II sporulation protein D
MTTTFTHEPTIAVGLIQQAESLSLALRGTYQSPRGEIGEDTFQATLEGGTILLKNRAGTEHARGECLSLKAKSSSCQFQTETTIGIDFHWQQRETQTFAGDLTLKLIQGKITLINHVPLESYISSVICSEMSPSAPADLTRAHAVISRSWLLAQLVALPSPTTATPSAPQGDTIERVLWYDRQAHTDFDVCADDHCQRYQGIGKITNSRVFQDIAATRGQVLSFGGEICDARFSKCCGGVVEDFTTAWGDQPVPYLCHGTDLRGAKSPPSLCEESHARAFIESRPAAFCDCSDASILQRVLPNFDQRTTDFFRWKVALTPEEIRSLILRKIQLDIGEVLALTPLERGPSGRLKRLRVKGSKKTLILGKELEIRRLLSPTHLYSSAFIIDTDGPPNAPTKFILRGAGWGHGVGLCQIGAAVMACEGVDYARILNHYYPRTELRRLY